jgi:hypothetical protein
MLPSPQLTGLPDLNGRKCMIGYDGLPMSTNYVILVGRYELFSNASQNENREHLCKSLGAFPSRPVS